MKKANFSTVKQINTKIPFIRVVIGIFLCTFA